MQLSVPRCLDATVSAALVLCSMYSIAMAPRVLCDVEECASDRLSTIFSIYPRAVAVACIASRVACSVYGDRSRREYRGNADRYDALYPAAAATRRRGRAVLAAAAVVCAAAIVPINVYRLVKLHESYGHVALTTFHAVMYAQNAAVCVTELRFLGHCVALFQRFRAINRELFALLSNVVDANGYPAVLKSAVCTGPADGRAADTATAAAGHARPLVDVVEHLKLRHRYVCDAVAHLNRLHGFQLGVSLSVLWLMALMDVYELLLHSKTVPPQRLFYVLWFFQYSFRFCTIVTAAHVTTREAQNSKRIITDINNNSTDNDTKEEIQLFLNEIANRSIDFTTFDMFTINVHLIISAIATGTTYLLILSQLDRNTSM